MSVDFKERDLLGGWSIEVSIDGLAVGRIRKHGSGYAYFWGMNNQLTPFQEAPDLASLKRDIEAAPARYT